jgi:TonB family protein
MVRVGVLGLLPLALAVSLPVKAAVPKGLKPASNPGEWITPDDYPPAALRANMKGNTAFLLAVDATGHVTGCTITASSGFTVLDQAACTLLVARATFIPATDRRGRNVATTYSSSVRWQIPQSDTTQRVSMMGCATAVPGDIHVVTAAGCL